MIVAVSALRVAWGGGRGPFFNSTDLDRPTELTHRSAAVVVLILIVMVMALADHDAVVSMPVSLTAANSQVTNADMDVFSDDWRRYSKSRCPVQYGLDTFEVCIGLTNVVPDASLENRDPAGAHQIKVNCPPYSRQRIRRIFLLNGVPKLTAERGEASGHQ